MVKKTLLALAALVVVLLGVMSVRAARMPSRQAAPEAPVSIAVDADAAAQRLAGAIRLRTISNERVEDTDTAAFLALHEYFAATYPLVHQNLRRETVAGLSLLYTWEGTDPAREPIVLMGHMDVVPVVPGTEGDWLHDPFGGQIADGQVWGRGSMDDKVSVVAALEAVEALLAEGFRPRRTVYLAFGHDEEVGGVRGAASIARLLRERGVSRFGMVVDEGGAVVEGMIPGIEGPVALVGVAEKGYVNLELLVEGPGGHSSTPPPHTNIGILAEAISELEENPFPASFAGPARDMFEWLAPEMSFGARFALGNLWLTGVPLTHVLLRSPETASMVRTTTAVTIVEGGVKANVLPITARAVVNFRVLPGETKESVMERVREVIGDERVQVSIRGDEGVDPSPVSNVEGPAFEVLARTVRQVMGERGVVVAPYLVMGGTDAKHFAQGSDAVFRFLPVPIGADALKLAHGTNERMSVDGLAVSIRFFVQLLRNSDAL
jgi:carboxypeptidase PM20D1